MARTALMRSLHRLACEHAEAERLGVDAAELRGRRGEAAALTRRELLAGAGAGAAALLLARTPARSFGAEAPRIAIVGGGIGGLTAAATLADAGLASTVYEAADRVGGRMHSDRRGYWSDGQTSEWCGELIDTNHKTILHLAQRFRLATSDLLAAEPNGSEDTLSFFGAYYPEAQADKDFQPVHQALQRDVQAASYPTTAFISTPGGIALDDMSVYDWIESRVPGGHGSPLGVYLDAAYNEEYGAETTDQSALNLVYLLGYNASPGNFSVFGRSDERYRIAGGNEQLPEAIAASLPASAVQLGARMSAIARRPDGTIALTIGGSTVVADHVILTLPFAVLRTLDYTGAQFEPLKVTAIEELGRGRNAKLQLQFTSRFWNSTGPWPGVSNGNSYSDTGYQNTWDVTRAQTGASGILVLYTGGDIAGSLAPSAPYGDASTDSAVGGYANEFLPRLDAVYPGAAVHWNGKATLSAPDLDPNLLASYVYYRVGQYHRFGGWEKLRQGNVHFAGEFCSQDFQGYMEGGASEGVRAANEILADLKHA
jgi:monoamine oxidase